MSWKYVVCSTHSGWLFHFAAETMNGKKKKKSAEQDIYSVFLISELISHFISLCLFLNSFF